MAIYKLADLYIDINPISDYTKRQLKNYLCNDTNIKPDFKVCITKEMITEECNKAPGLMPAYYESIAIYRYICMTVLEKYNGMFFHCSALAVDNKAYLFAAPSGTGKSTHARMWREAFGDRVIMINDDKPLIRELNGKFYVYGTPWDGKHSLSNNIRVPVYAVCLLKRGNENSIERVSGTDHLADILNQTIVPKHHHLLNNLLNFLEKFLSSVNIYTLQCTISPQAAITAYNFMHNNQKGDTSS